MSKHYEKRRVEAVQALRGVSDVLSEFSKAKRAFGLAYAAHVAAAERACSRLEVADGLSHDFEYPDVDDMNASDPTELEEHSLSFLGLAMGLDRGL
jgi:hypothetical protein